MPLIEALPLFPLSDVVLLPEVSVPLYVFEPRYRQMTRDALAGARQIGMITVRPEGTDQMAEDPPLFEIGCLGRIVHSQERPDGTFQILLAGESRFRVESEHPRTGDRLYRSARVETLEDPETDSEADSQRLHASRAAVLELLSDFLRGVHGEESPGAMLEGFAALEPVRMVNALTQSISFAPVERQRLLEAPSVASRFQIMEDLLRFEIAEARIAQTSSGSLPN